MNYRIKSKKSKKQQSCLALLLTMIMSFSSLLVNIQPVRAADTATPVNIFTTTTGYIETLPVIGAVLKRPEGVAFDSSGNIYICDYLGNRILETAVVDHTQYGINMIAGNTYTIAGTGTMGYNGDNIAAKDAQLSVPSGIAVDNQGNVYIGDLGNNRLRKIDSSGIITTVAGNGNFNDPDNGNGVDSGDNGPAASAGLKYPSKIAIDASGNIYISCELRVREIAAVDHKQYGIDMVAGNIYTVAGNGNMGAPVLENALATDSVIYNPGSITVDINGNLYIPIGAKVFKVDAVSDKITTIAGTGDYGYSGDGGLATQAHLGNPYGVAIDSAGNLYIADSGTFTIRKVDSNGIISTVVGNGTLAAIETAGYDGNGGPAINAKLSTIKDVKFDGNGNMYIIESNQFKVIRYVQMTDGVPRPTAVPAAGDVAANTPVTLSTAVTGASIYYTIDGSTPTAGSTLYTAPITITGTMTIKAVAVKDGNIVSGMLIAPYSMADTTPPTWPAGTQVTASNITTTSMTLTWPAATDDRAVNSYEIYQGDTLLKTVSGTTLSSSISNLTPGTSYEFKIRAGDSGNKAVTPAVINWSDFSQPLVVKTLSNPPTLTADSTATVASSNVNITFTDDPNWRSAITQVQVKSTILKANQYTLSPGKLSILTAGTPLATVGSNYKVNITAAGYTQASVIQAIKNAPSAPVLTGAVSSNDGSKIILTFGKTMADPAGKEGQFTVHVDAGTDSVTAASLNTDPTKIELTLATPILNGQTVSVDYVTGTITAADNGVLASLSGQAVTNNVPLPEDKEAPVITLVGDSTVNIENGAVYTDAGVTITDNKDTKLVATVTYTKDGNPVDSIDTKSARTYVIHYNVSDAAGNPAAEVTRTAIVAPAASNTSVTGLNLDKTNATVQLGKNITLTATVTPDNATNKKVTWSSSNEAVATVDQTGKVTGVKEGKATITATTEDGNISKQCEVTVTIDECFIATAAYGSKYQSSVVLLRHFRDDYLLTNTLGAEFVKFYYKNSPPIANFIAHNEVLKTTVRVLLTPFVGTVYGLYHPVVGCMTLVLICMLVLVKRRYRPHRKQ